MDCTRLKPSTMIAAWSESTRRGRPNRAELASLSTVAHSDWSGKSAAIRSAAELSGSPVTRRICATVTGSTGKLSICLCIMV